ncbi:MAG TPA: hypothetical protein VJT73_16770 [Polyangiaceae bacterium]|nr:hypothetical protein [Polyangiaceae bacterium]
MRSQMGTLVAFLWAMVAACGGGTPAASTPNPLDDAPPAEPTARPPSSPAEVDPKKNKFDEEESKVVLARAAGAAHTCVDVAEKSAPHGDATVVVTFSGRGKSTNATINPPFDGTPIGQCATRAFVNIIISPFEGPDVEKSYPVNLKPDDKGSKKDAVKPKK